jgi:hypothetical protein
MDANAARPSMAREIRFEHRCDDATECVIVFVGMTTTTPLVERIERDDASNSLHRHR